MASQRLKNAKGQTIGRLETLPSGVLRIKNAKGKTLGTYNPKTDKTKDYKGKTVGKGNLLTTLL